MRRWVLFWCVQSYAWAWDAPAAVQPGHELAPDPYASHFVLAPDPYPVTPVNRQARQMNRRARSRVSAQLAPSPYDISRALLAPMPYAGRLPGHEIARPRAQPLALAASPYNSLATPELAADPY